MRLSDFIVNNTKRTIRKRKMDSPEVKDFVVQLAREADRFFVRYVPTTDYGFTKLDVRNLLIDDMMWTWVDASNDRFLWLINAIRNDFEINNHPLSIDDGGIIRHKVEPRLT